MTPPTPLALDPVIDLARRIAATHRINTERDTAWQRHETALAATARRHGLTFLQVTRSNLPDARALRTLDRARRRTRRFIQRAVAQLSHTPARTPHGALAKLDLALFLADPDLPTDPPLDAHLRGDRRLPPHRPHRPLGGPRAIQSRPSGGTKRTAYS